MPVPRYTLTSDDGLTARERFEANWRGIGNGLPPLAGGAGTDPAYSVEVKKTKTTTTPRTALQLLAGTTPFKIVEFGISSNGTSGLILIELLTGTNATNEAEGTEVTPKLIRGVEGSKALTKARAWYTAGKEPTVLTMIKQWECPLPMAPFVIQAPLGRETGSNSITTGKAGYSVAFRLTASTGEPEVLGYVEIEE